MKYYKYFVVVLTFVLLSGSVFAQKKELTKKQWQNEINRLTAKKASLTTQLHALQTEVNNLRSTDASLQSYEDCMKGLYALVETNKQGIDNFRMQVNSLSSKISRKEPPKENAQAELNNLKKNKISALPEFYDLVHNVLQRKLDAWKVKPKEIFYTVIKGDCLWRIAKKKTIYDNPFAWPKIYKSNRDQIKNPDLIYPKQIFKIPNLTEAEQVKYEKIRKNYKPAPPEQTK